jgi:death-on-curing protein
LQTPKFLRKAVVLAIHEEQVNDSGGSLEILDEGLLESAIAQPQMTYGGNFLHPEIHDQAAAYLYYISKDHAFMHANKRTAVGAAEAFLNINGYDLLLSNEQLRDLAVEVVRGNISREELSEKLRCSIQKL